MPTPIALTIAGSDPSGGAGIQADLKTFTVMGVYGAAVISALTAQSTQGVAGLMPVPAEFVARQIDCLAADMQPTAVKTGMLHDADTVRAVAAAVRRHDLHPLVVDPVMVATSGDALMRDDLLAALIDELLPLADLLTPNLPEAARLLGRDIATSEAAMIEQARALLALGAKAVVVKGGHADGDEAVDILIDGTGDGAVHRLVSPRVATRNTHGTGCTFSAAIAAALALGASLPAAVQQAKAFVHAALVAGANLDVGKGAGPLDHIAATHVTREHD